MRYLTSALSSGAAALLAAALVLTACGDDSSTPGDPMPDAAGTTPDAAPAPVDAAGGGELVHCLDRPDEVQRAPTGQLPCDLLPPGFGG